jgi:hypothetical protein
MTSYAEMDRLRKLARPLYLELHAMSLELVASVDEGGEWCLEVEGLRSLSPAHAERVMVRIQEHERGLLWCLYGSWDEEIEAIRGELR